MFFLFASVIVSICIWFLKLQCIDISQLSVFLLSGTLSVWINRKHVTNNRKHNCRFTSFLHMKNDLFNCGRRIERQKQSAHLPTLIPPVTAVHEADFSGI